MWNKNWLFFLGVKIYTRREVIYIMDVKKAWNFLADGMWGLMMALAVLVLLFEVGVPLEASLWGWWKGHAVEFIGLVLLFGVGALGHYHKHDCEKDKA